MDEPDRIDAYHARQTVADQIICARLRSEIDDALPDATSKIWHAEPGLKAEGKFKAAEARYAASEEIKLERLHGWLRDSREIQWDYKNIVKRKGVLERLK